MDILSVDVNDGPRVLTEYNRDGVGFIENVYRGYYLAPEHRSKWNLVWTCDYDKRKCKVELTTRDIAEKRLRQESNGSWDAPNIAFRYL